MKKTTVITLLAIVFAAMLLAFAGCEPGRELTEAEVIQIVQKGASEGKGYKITKLENGKYILQETEF